MRNLYHPTNKLVRANFFRSQAAECERAGFHHFAEWNLEMADLLESEHSANLKAEVPEHGDR